MAGIVTQVISSRFSTDTTATRVVSWMFLIRPQLELFLGGSRYDGNSGDIILPRLHFWLPTAVPSEMQLGQVGSFIFVFTFFHFHFYFHSLLNRSPLYIVSHFPEMQLGQVGSLQLRRNALSPVSPGICHQLEGSPQRKKRQTFNSFHFVIFFGKFCLIVKVYQTKFANLNDSVGCTKKAYICHIVLRKRANKWPISSF